MSISIALALALAQDTWKADDGLLEQLQAATDLGPYSFRPPRGYQGLRPPDAPAGTQAFGWQGRPRQDQTMPMITLTLITPPPSDAEMTLNGFLNAMLGGVKRRRTEWSQSDVEKGRVNGLDFLRVRWTGLAQGAKMHGFMYVARDGGRFIQFASQDVDPHHEEALKLSETAVLTFSKR